MAKTVALKMDATIPLEDEKADKSHELDMLKMMQRCLSEDDIIFHSRQILNHDGGREQHEADFIIWHQVENVVELLVLECKAWKNWYYNSLQDKYYRMKNNGGDYTRVDKSPYKQALINANHLRENILEVWKETHLGTEVGCPEVKVVSAVWWYYEKDVSEFELSGDARGVTIIGHKDEDYVRTKIYEILQQPLKIDGKVKAFRPLSQDQQEWLKEKYFFHNEGKYSREYLDDEFRNMMTAEQSAIFKYLDQARTAAVCGKAGTGKTKLAESRARDYAAGKEKTLLLMFNSRLQGKLEADMVHCKSVDVCNIDRFVTTIRGKWNQGEDTKAYDDAKRILQMQFKEGTFKYKHVIIDEGQDFTGRKQELIDMLYDYVQQSGAKLETMYCFYDYNQFVQGSGDLPKICREAENRLSLYLNCRNTEKIANTVDAFLQVARMKTETEMPDVEEQKRKPIAVKPEFVQVGEDVVFYNINAAEDKNVEVKDIVESFLAMEDKRGTHLENIQIISCAGVTKSLLVKPQKEGDSSALYVTNGGRKMEVVNSRTFKGLEADVVILIDVDSELCLKAPKNKKAWGNRLLPYVAASRAKKRLYVVADFDLAFCNNVIKKIGKESKRDDLEGAFDKVCLKVFGAVTYDGYGL